MGLFFDFYTDFYDLGVGFCVPGCICITFSDDLQFFLYLVLARKKWLGSRGGGW